MNDLLGKTLGKYQVIKRLGRGGMAEVYLARHPNLERDVAIKVMYPHLADTQDFIRRFKQEATAVARLRHPNIVQIHDFDIEGDVYYMLMEFITGSTLSAELEERRTRGQNFTLAQTCEIFGELASAVDYAHKQGMIHRDLKPANVMLNREGQAILTDFGVAHLLEGGGRTCTGAPRSTMKATPWRHLEPFSTINKPLVLTENVSELLHRRGLKESG